MRAGARKALLALVFVAGFVVAFLAGEYHGFEAGWSNAASTYEAELQKYEYAEPQPCEVTVTVLGPNCIEQTAATKNAIVIVNEDGSFLLLVDEPYDVTHYTVGECCHQRS